MFKLFGAPLKNRPSGQCCEGYENTFTTHDPEHIESADCIKGVETL
jgi:hypothetical protein